MTGASVRETQEFKKKHRKRAGIKATNSLLKRQFGSCVYGTWAWKKRRHSTVQGFSPEPLKDCVLGGEERDDFSVDKGKDGFLTVDYP